LYLDFLQDVKYSLSEKIANLINQAFESLDSKKEKKINANKLLESYHPEQHPHVLTRRKSP